MNKLKIIEINKGNVYIGVSKNDCGRTYLAKRNFKKGDIIIHGYGKIIDHQTSKISIQISMKKHFLPFQWAGRFWNHSCNPNAHIKTRKDGFPDWVALRNIRRGEEVNYAYCGTEYKWSKEAAEHLINCKCQEEKCRGKIDSFSDLSLSEQKRIIKSEQCSKYLVDYNSKLASKE